MPKVFFTTTGLLLIVAGFWVVLGNLPWTATQGLDLAVCIGLFAIININMGVFALDSAGFDSLAPTLGVRMAFTTVYSSAALGSMALVAIYAIPFKFAALFQVALLVLAFAALSMIILIRQRAEGIATNEKAMLEGGIDALRKLVVNALENASDRGDSVRLGTLRDELRYLSACSTREAASLEQKLADHLGLWCALDGAAKMAPVARAASLAEMERLLKQRKTCQEV